MICARRSSRSWKPAPPAAPACESMQRFIHPTEPDGFHKAVDEQRKLLEELFAKGKLGRVARKQPRRPKGGGSVALEPPTPVESDEELEEHFPDKWSSFKAALSKAQYKKCGYCDGAAIGNADGDVEHYRPKAEIHELHEDPESWGAELDDVANVRGRKTNPVSGLGYWWQAYEWKNYLLACGVCNRKWKRTLFPIGEARDPKGPSRTGGETALLLNPFGEVDPADHLQFGRLGEVVPFNGS